MRALLVTFGSILQPRGGLQVRARTTLDALSFLGVEMKVVSTEEPGVRAEIRVLRRRPFFGWSPGLVAAVATSASGCDFVVVEDATLMPAVVMARVSLPIIWDTNECQTLHYTRLPRTTANRLRLRAWRAFERFSARRCRLAVAIGGVEARWWTDLFPSLEGKLMVVDHTPRLVGSGSGARTVRNKFGVPDGPLLLFVGTMAAKHNAAAARWLLDVLAPALPAEVTLAIAGPGSQRLTARADSAGQVLCLGDVEDLDALIEASDLCLAPLGAGAGVKTKVLHYLAHGKPVAGTPVAFEGLDGAPGLLARELDELPRAILDRLGSGAVENEGLGREQRAWVEATHGPELVAKQWRFVLDRLATGR